MKSVHRFSKIPRNSLAALQSTSFQTSSLSLGISRSFPATIRGFKNDSQVSQAISSQSSSNFSIRDDPIFSSPFKSPSNQTNTPGQNMKFNSPLFSTDRSSTTSTWSSPYEAIPRHQFLKDYSHLLTLLEACLETENFTRAESVLVSFSEHSNAKDITMAVNKYLLRLAEVNETNSSVVPSWLNKISGKIKQFRPDTVTYSIILKNKCLSSNYNFDIKTFIKQHSPDVLKHIDVLGIEMIAKVVQLTELPISVVDPRFREVVSQFIEKSAASEEFANTSTFTSSTIPELTADANPEHIEQKSNTEAKEAQAENFATLVKTLNINDIESLPKPGAKELASVDSYGLKAIRHTLSGFLSDKDSFNKVMDSLTPYVAEKSANDNNYTDFFKITKEIESSNATEEEKAKFYQAFDDYNWSRQKDIERKGLEGASLKWKYTHDKMRAAGALSLKPLEALFWEWSLSMQTLLEQEISKIQDTLGGNGSKSKVKKTASKRVSKKNKEQEKDLELIEDENDDSLDLSVGDRLQYGPYLLLVKPQKLAILTILELFKLVSTSGITEGMKTARAVLSVGKAVEMEYKSAQQSRREKDILKGVSTSSIDQPRETMMAVQNQVKESKLSSEVSWPSEIRAKVGSLLISLLIHVAKVPVRGKDPVTGDTVTGKAPAFYHGYQYQGGTRVGVLKVHNFLSKYIAGDAPSNMLQPQLLPMLVKPQPWTSWRSGGYLYSSTSVMRTKDAPEQLAYLKAASNNGDLDQVYDGLNVLGNTAWTINTPLFKVITEVWNKNEPFLEIPGFSGPPVFPPEPSRSEDPQVRRDWLRQCRKIHNENMSSYSERCTINYKLEIARAYLGERFYFPHNMDFRGRAYPLSPHLNHLGNDLSRSLLMFWEGRRLGKAGLKWLKIHAANVVGYDKFSFEDREKFIDEHLGDVFDSAERPLDGERWWMQGSDPWQTLAACIEITNAMSMENPEDYISHLPVHQDGTCNGLQHYAALGGDVEGAKQVNLVPSDKPQDVYTKVLEIVKEYVEEDAKNGEELAVILKDQLVRKVIKQTVMTTVYGVTFIGARAQIASQLKGKEGITEENMYRCSMYLTRKVFLAVRALFEGAHLIQDWLGDSASKIAKSVRLDIDTPAKRNGSRPDFMSSVIWTTPLGLPIVQPYRESRKIQVSTKLQTVQLTDPYALRAVNARKQRTAFPPNYVHSLDASHMLLSASECGRQNLQFASVHDSYWTHAADVEKMSTILRDAFISLHKVDLVAQLHNEFEQRYGGMLEFVQIPRYSEVGQKIISVRQRLISEKIQDDRHAALEGASSSKTKSAAKPKQTRGKPSASSLTAEHEIAIERERMALLSSEDPEDIERGKSMVTPLSIIETLSQDEIKALIQEAADSKNNKKKVKKVYVKSTEHHGTGYDKHQDENNDISEDASEDTSAAYDSESPKMTDSLVGKKSDTTIGVFVRLTIDEVPPKGEFDVHELSQSKYFFS